MIDQLKKKRIMKKEDKELLLKDLCARLPYGVIVRGIFINYNKDKDKILYEECDKQLNYQDLNRYGTLKPYLRPMSSMTEDEKKYINYKWDADEYGNMMTFSSYEGGVSEIELADIVGFQDWLNKNMFDYRGLIPQNLAIEITEENNPYKN